MKPVNHKCGVGKHFFYDFGEAYPHVSAHFHNLLTHRYRLLLKSFNDLQLLMTVNHVQEPPSLKIPDNGGKVPMSFTATGFIDSDVLCPRPTLFFLTRTDD
jgi:hypothetical protein